MGRGIQINVWFSLSKRVDKIIWPPYRVSRADVSIVIPSSEWIGKAIKSDFVEYVCHLVKVMRHYHSISVLWNNSLRNQKRKGLLKLLVKLRFVEDFDSDSKSNIELLIIYQLLKVTKTPSDLGSSLTDSSRIEPWFGLEFNSLATSGTS